MEVKNIGRDLPDATGQECVEPLVKTKDVLIERIVSRGQASAPEVWYDSAQIEWVMLVQGRARLMWEDGRVSDMEAGDHVTIPAHCRHRVDWTAPDQDCVWVAVMITP